MSKRNSIMGGLAWKLGERFLSQGVMFLVSIVLARLVLPEEYGIVSLVLVFVNLSSVFVVSGFGSGLIQKKDADETDFSTMFFCSVVCSLLIYLVIFLCAPFVASFYRQPVLTVVLRVFALQVPLGTYNVIQNAYVSRHMLFHKLFASTIISTVVSGGIGIGIAVAGGGGWALVAQSLSAMLTNTLVLAFMLPWHPTWRFSVPAAKSLMKYSSRILLADLSGTFFLELRSLIIGRVYTSADLAYYSKGQQMPSFITNNLSASVMTVLFPAMANLNEDIAQVKVLTKRSMQILAYVLFPTLFGLAAVMDPLIRLVFTDKWASCIPYGQILSIGFAVSVFGSIPLQTIKAIGRSDVVFKLEFIKKPIYLLLLLLGVRISVMAIAVTMMLYDIYGTVVNMRQLKKYIGYGLFEQFCNIFPAMALSGVMAVIVALIPNVGGLFLTLVTKLATGVIVYLFGSAILKLDSFFYLKDALLDIVGTKKKHNER